MSLLNYLCLIVLIGGKLYTNYICKVFSSQLQNGVQFPKTPPNLHELFDKKYMETSSYF